MPTKRDELPEKVVAALYRKDYRALKGFLTGDIVNLPDEGGLTLLMLAVLADDADPEIIQFLIDRGADVNLAERTEQYTALHFAARDLRRDIVAVLLEARADVNAQNASGWTPLHHVVMAQDPRELLIGRLLDHGADPHLKDASGASAIETAHAWGQDNLFQNVTPPKPKKGAKKRAAIAPPPFMEHPSDNDYLTAVEAMADAIKRLRKLPKWNDWITFTAQGMGGRVDSYHFAGIRMRQGNIRLPEPIEVDRERIARQTGVPRKCLVRRRKDLYSIAEATPMQAARIMDAIFREHLGIRPHTGEGDDYAIVAEW